MWFCLCPLEIEDRTYNLDMTGNWLTRSRSCHLLVHRMRLQPIEPHRPGWDLTYFLKGLCNENVFHLVHWFGLKYANLMFLSVFKKYKQDLIPRYHDLKHSWEVWKGSKQMSTSLGLKYTNFISLIIQICMRLLETLNGLSLRIKEGSYCESPSPKKLGRGWKTRNFKKGVEENTGKTSILT